MEIGRVLPTALSDTEVEVNGHLSKYWECENSGRVQQSSKVKKNRKNDYSTYKTLSTGNQNRV